MSEPKLITLKTPKIKYSDMGYLRKNGTNVEIELFVAGTSIEKISINDDVCVGILCMDEKEFVKQYLYPNYPSDTMRNVLLGRDIFKGQGFSEMCNGTQYQYIQNDDMDIVYRRKPGEIYFKDRLNGLLIQIKDVKEN